MKKLLSFFAAGLLAVGSLGVMSCSGDLQDNDVQPLAIVGITNDPGNHVIPMTLDKPDGSEQSLKITFNDGFELLAADGKKYKLTDDYTGSWRQDNGNGPITASRFKVIPSSAIKADGTPSWADDYGSLNGDDVQYLIAGETFSKVGRRGDKGVSGDPKHIVFDSVIAGETYILRAKYDSVKGSLELKLDGTADNPTEMKINIVGESKNFPAKDENKKDLTYTMNKAGKEYTYQFISVADETIEFNLSNPMYGTFYAGATDGALKLEDDDNGNLSYDVKKNVEYKITVNLGTSVVNPTIKAEAVDMLKNATVKANWKYADNFYEVEYKSPFYFQAENTDLSFTVNRISGDDTLAWGTASAIDVDGKAVELTYTEEGKAKPVVVKGLKKGDWYLVELAENNETFTLTAKVISAPIPDISTFNSYMWSNVNNSSWGQDTTKYPYPKGFPKFVKDSTQENTFYCDFSPVDTSVEFGIKKFNDEVETDGISNWYGCGAEIKGLNTEVSGDITKGNSKIIGLEAGKNYRLYVTFLNPVIVSMKVIGK